MSGGALPPRGTIIQNKTNIVSMIKTLTGKFYECKVHYEKTTEDGSKMITECCVVDAHSFSEAENRILEIMKQYFTDVDVTAIKIASYKEYLVDENVSSDKYYKVRCNYITIDEKNGKEKKTAVDYLVKSMSVEEARRNMDEAMRGTMIDYTISSVSETNVVDIYI